VRRFALAVVEALLSFTASGVATLVAGEPCTSFEQGSREDDTCAPTCVTCGCCAQAAEPVVLSVTNSPDDPLTGLSAYIPLHVPKFRSI
jgi:hypothetical protein